MQNGVIYEGPSLYDGEPIVVISTWSKRNSKTGGVLQTYVLLRDIDPRDASKSGQDFTICGNCPHRGTPTDDPDRKIAKDRDCYVNLGQGVLSVWRSYQSGVYPDAQNDIASLGRGRVVRIGTYGNPSAVPEYVWDQLLSECRNWTAYNHGETWRPDIAMQSADSLAEAQAAWDKGARTFRVVESVDEITDREILCPASKEAGRRTVCAKCLLCSGTATKSPKSIAIPMH